MIATSNAAIRYAYENVVAAPGAEARREAQRDHVEALQRERQRDAFAEHRAAATSPGPSGRPTPPRQTQRAERNAERDRAVHREPPAEGDHAVVDRRAIVTTTPIDRAERRTRTPPSRSRRARRARWPRCRRGSARPPTTTIHGRSSAAWSLALELDEQDAGDCRAARATATSTSAEERRARAPTAHVATSRPSRPAGRARRRSAAARSRAASPRRARARGRRRRRRRSRRS